MPSLSSLIKEVAAKAGIKSDNQELQTLLAHSILETVQVNDALSSEMEKGLLSMESAKNNSQVAEYFYKRSFRKVGSEIADIGKKFGLSEDDIDDILAEENLSKKSELLISKVVETKTKDFTKSGSGDESSKTKLATAEQTIAELRKQLSDKDTEKTTLEAEFAQKLSAKDLGYIQNGKINAQPWTDAISPSVRQTVINDLLQKEAAKYGWQYGLNEAGTDIEIKTKDGLKAYDEKNKEVSFDGLLQKIMAENKLIKVSTSESTKTQLPVDNGKKGDPEKGKPSNPLVDKAFAKANAVNQANLNS